MNNRREFLNTLKDQQTNNLNLKIDLCVKAESLKESKDWRKTSQDLINLQKEWKSIGPVPRRQSEKVWKRFRSACDEFFNNKSTYFKNIHVVEDENLKGKEELVKGILSFEVAKDKAANLDALKSFQRKWMDLGHVPFKEKERIQNEYRAAIDQLIDRNILPKIKNGNLNIRRRGLPGIYLLLLWLSEGKTQNDSSKQLIWPPQKIRPKYSYQDGA